MAKAVGASIMNYKTIKAMKMNMLLTPLAVFICIATLGQPSAYEKKEEVSSRGFHTIRVATGISAVLKKSNRQDVTISASTPIYRDRVYTKVQDSVLYIYYEEPRGANFLKFRRQPPRKLEAVIHYKTLKKIWTETGAIVRHEGLVQGDSFTLTAEGASIITLEIDTRVLSATVSEGSIINIKGNAGSTKVFAETGSEFRGTNFVTSTCDVKAETGSIVSIHATQQLRAKAETGSIIRYWSGVKDLKKEGDKESIVPRN